MSAGVNLIPPARLHAWRRAVRRRRWIVICGALAGLLVVGVSLRWKAGGMVDDTSRHILVLQERRAEIERKLISANTEHGKLLERLRLIAAARRPQRWPQWLLQLNQEAPTGIVLAALDVSPAVAPRPPRSATRASARQDPVVVQEIAKREQIVQLRGLATDHAELLQFLNVLQRIPGWQQVELVRAALEPYGRGMAISFELACRTMEELP